MSRWASCSTLPGTPSQDARARTRRKSPQMHTNIEVAEPIQGYFYLRSCLRSLFLGAKAVWQGEFLRLAEAILLLVIWFLHLVTTICEDRIQTLENYNNKKLLMVNQIEESSKSPAFLGWRSGPAIAELRQRRIVYRGWNNRYAFSSDDTKFHNNAHWRIWTWSPFSQVLHEAIENKVTMNACKHTRFRIQIEWSKRKISISIM
jgi:hypothetical protein